MSNITASGHHFPTPLERRYVRDRADASFERYVGSDLALSLPPSAVPDGYTPVLPSAILLATRNVYPHTDRQLVRDAVAGHWHYAEGNPARSRTLFWVTEVREDATLVLQVGDESVAMRAGSWVVFDETVLHCVVASHLWRGVVVPLDPTAATAVAAPLPA